MLRAVAVGTVLLISGSIIGCASHADDELVMFPVRGTVRVNGKPATGARVIFHPHDEEIPATPFGVVDDEGVFELSTFLANDGAPEGDYSVTISWAPPLSGGSDPEMGEERLPSTFQDPHGSGIVVTIEAEPNDLEPFDISL